MTDAVARSRIPRRLLLFLIALTLARLLLAAVIPLTEDEAYYRLWARSLQFGYYDHPPMIAWWIRAGMTLAGDDPLGVRLLPALSSGATSLLAFDLARRLGGSVRTASRAAIWLNATLLIAAGGFLATPDAAAVPFWTATLCCLARTPGPRPACWWLAAGVAAGLSCISKYSGLFLLPGVLLWLLARPGGLKVLRGPWPWLAGLAAALVFSGNVIWNATHHWASFEKQFGRVAPARFAPGYLAELIAGQVMLLNPAIAWFAARGLGPAWRDKGAEGEDGSAGLRLLVCVSAPFALYLLLHSLHDRAQAHWPAPLYPSLAIIAAVEVERVRSAGAQAWMRALAAPLGLGLGGLVLLHMALPASDLQGVRDPTAQIRGWPAFAARVEALRQAGHAGWIGTLSYGTAAQLDAQPETRAPVVELGERDRYPPPDGSWRADPAAPGLVIDLDRRVSAAALGRCFAHVIPAGEVLRGAADPTPYRAFLISGPRRDILHQGC
ncbi:MAG: glycosyltransferase family 39 protein [Caulobacteraceae bacterium]|nr:glycosyltransferase family 39 protein [Caulobacteraceae bacterium]